MAEKSEYRIHLKQVDNGFLLSVWSSRNYDTKETIHNSTAEAMRALQRSVENIQGDCLALPAAQE